MSPDPYNKHRPTQRVPAGQVHPATSDVPPAARSIAPARKVSPQALQAGRGAIIRQYAGKR